MKPSLPLVERVEIAQRTSSFAFDLEGRSYPFKPGQYVTVTMSAPLYRDDKGSSRSFSIASSPGEPRLMLATRMTGSAFKRSLGEAPLGTQVQVSGPSGAFVLPREATKPVGLVAGGIGITPFRSMIKAAVERQLPRELTLVYFNRTPEDAPFLKELESWDTGNRNFRLIAVMTQPAASKRGWRGRTGHVDAGMLGEALGDLGSFDFYVAGPEAMVEGATAALIEAGASLDNILTEAFPGY